MRAFRLLLLCLAVLCCVSCRDFRVRGNTVTVTVQPASSDMPGFAPASLRPRQVRLQVLGEELIRVSATPGRRFADRASLVVVPQPDFRDFRVEET